MQTVGGIGRRAVDGAIQVVLFGGGVVAVAQLLATRGPASALGWLIALTASGLTVVALWDALNGVCDLRHVVDVGSLAASFMLTQTLFATAWPAYGRLLAVLACLVLLRFRLDAAADRVDPGMRRAEARDRPRPSLG